MVPVSAARRVMIPARLLIVEFTFSSIFCAFWQKNIAEGRVIVWLSCLCYDDCLYYVVHIMYVMCSDGE